MYKEKGLFPTFRAMRYLGLGYRLGAEPSVGISRGLVECFLQVKGIQEFTGKIY
jgi:hypothetical protein